MLLFSVKFTYKIELHVMLWNVISNSKDYTNNISNLKKEMTSFNFTCVYFFKQCKHLEKANSISI